MKSSGEEPEVNHTELAIKVSSSRAHHQLNSHFGPQIVIYHGELYKFQLATISYFAYCDGASHLINFRMSKSMIKNVHVMEMAKSLLK